MQSNLNNQQYNQGLNNQGLNQGLNNQGLNQGLNQGQGLNTYTSTNVQSTRTINQVLLPTQVIEKPTAIHEEIRREQVEEIQPIVNVEKIQTEVHQVTQPLLDKEIKPIVITERTLPGQILPEVINQTTSVPRTGDISTVSYRESSSVTVEKPPIFMETDKRQIIEEIQPVIYKETVVPTVIRETKPMYQKIVEGTTYIQETLPPRQLSGTGFQYPQNVTYVETPQTIVPQTIVPQSIPQTTTVPIIQKKPQVVEETVTTTTTTTTNSPYQPL